MATSSQKLRERAGAALKLVRETKPVLAELGIEIDERSAAAIPLVLASMDAAEAIYALLINQPEESWVAALIMQRSQMEYVLRSAYFARAASKKELLRFRKNGAMPKRGKRPIYIAEVATEASQHLGWEKTKLLATVRSHHKHLSGLVHGGKEVLAIYTMHDTWGDLTIDWEDLIDHVDNVMVFVQLALGVAMSLSPLDAEGLDKAVRPIYDKAHAYFGNRGPVS
ncbi:hypothetical protein [Pseudoxanthomonas sp. UTMC 1351]|uniref:hypothetical protein n=1 Tax=Pseudoxanthomonas sp. UTMC 1351 TaxID=2695853 RepID=UPI0034CD106B